MSKVTLFHEQVKNRIFPRLKSYYKRKKGLKRVDVLIISKEHLIQVISKEQVSVILGLRLQKRRERI